MCGDIDVARKVIDDVELEPVTNIIRRPVGMKLDAGFDRAYGVRIQCIGMDCGIL